MVAARSSPISGGVEPLYFTPGYAEWVYAILHPCVVVAKWVTLHPCMVAAKSSPISGGVEPLQNHYRTII